MTVDYMIGVLQVLDTELFVDSHVVILVLGLGELSQ